MDNPIYKNKEDMEFIEKNYDDLSASIGPEKYTSKYYIGSFRYPKREFNTGAGYYQSLWFGYRKMYKESFFVGFLSTIIIVLSVFFSMLIVPKVLYKGDIQTFFIKLDQARYTGNPFSSPAVLLLIIIPIIVTYIYIFFLGKYANYIYFRSLKNRIISKNIIKYGKSKVGVLWGFLLGVLGVILATIVLGLIAALYIFAVK